MLFAAIAFSVCFGSCAREDDRIIGEWKGMDLSNHPVILIFDKSKHAVFTIGSTTIGGDNCIINGRKIKLEYEIDYTETPHKIDLTQIIDGEKSKYTFSKGIFRFISDTKMETRMRLGDEKRFTTFDSTDKENSIILEKIRS